MNKKFFFSQFCLEKINTKLEKYSNFNSIILTTSGTTSSPKFVRLSNRNLYINSMQIINYLKIKKITIQSLHYLWLILMVYLSLILT